METNERASTSTAIRHTRQENEKAITTKESGTRYNKIEIKKLGILFNSKKIYDNFRKIRIVLCGRSE